VFSKYTIIVDTILRFPSKQVNGGVAVATRGRTIWLFYSRINTPRLLDPSSAVLLKLPRSGSKRQVDLMQFDVEYTKRRTTVARVCGDLKSQNTYVN